MRPKIQKSTTASRSVDDTGVSRGDSTASSRTRRDDSVVLSEAHEPSAKDAAANRGRPPSPDIALGRSPSNTNDDPSLRIYAPGPADILLGRGKPYQSHSGNQRMLQIIDQLRAPYHQAERNEKHAIIEEVLAVITSRGGRFITRVDYENYWVEVRRSISYRKVGHAFRSKARLSKNSTTPLASSNVPCQSHRTSAERNRSLNAFPPTGMMTTLGGGATNPASIGAGRGFSTMSPAIIMANQHVQRMMMMNLPNPSNPAVLSSVRNPMFQLSSYVGAHPTDLGSLSPGSSMMHSGRVGVLSPPDPVVYHQYLLRQAAARNSFVRGGGMPRTGGDHVMHQNAFLARSQAQMAHQSLTSPRIVAGFETKADIDPRNPNSSKRKTPHRDAGPSG